MTKNVSVETSTQVGSEENKMSSQRERKVFEDEVLPDYEDECEDNNENDDDWKERSYEELQELIDESENPQEDNEEESESSSL